MREGERERVIEREREYSYTAMKVPAYQRDKTEEIHPLNLQSQCSCQCL